ncbi:MAG: hypothetical protein ISR64_07390 [Deltaproteobacteria bacterium]|nr:hypothetical protein [Deltaproteobacteria bacterium]
MLDRMWETLKGKKNVIEEARSDCLRMMATGREMFNLVVQALEKDMDIQVREKVAGMDKTINAQQQDVRKKIYEHLALSRTRDLLQGLQLMTIVVDLERIGDYGKNMAELVDMLPDKMSFDKYEEHYREVQEGTLELFDLTRDALANGDEEKAREVLRRYDTISKICDGTLRGVITAEGYGDCVDKWKLGLVLLLRYMKRVSAHLKNIASAVINPFHRIGYRA